MPASSASRGRSGRAHKKMPRRATEDRRHIAARSTPRACTARGRKARSDSFARELVEEIERVEEELAIAVHDALRDAHDLFEMPLDRSSICGEDRQPDGRMTLRETEKIAHAAAGEFLGVAIMRVRRERGRKRLRNVTRDCERVVVLPRIDDGNSGAAIANHLFDDRIPPIDKPFFSFE